MRVALREIAQNTRVARHPQKKALPCRFSLRRIMGKQHLGLSSRSYVYSGELKKNAAKVLKNSKLAMLSDPLNRLSQKKGATLW
jgi:hypothetical protein